MKFWVIVKKNLMTRGKKKMLNVKLERYIVGLHALLHGVFTFIYIYID